MGANPLAKLKKKDLIRLSEELDAQIQSLEEENRTLRQMSDYPDLSALAPGSFEECGMALFTRADQSMEIFAKSEEE